MRRGARGFTLIELVLALMLSALLGVVVVRILLTTSRFYAGDSARRNARVVARGPLGLLRAELRNIEPGGGLIAADSQSLTVRSGYATGLVCTAGSGQITVSLMPADSLPLASASFAGVAWRGESGAWTYADGGTITAGGSASCGGAGIAAGGAAVVIITTVPAFPQSGSPVFLYQRVTYRFAASSALPGRLALWRLTGTSGSDELAAPFGSGARFRFHTASAESSLTAAPSPLSAMRGIELVLDGASEKPPRATGTPAATGLTTSVFFRNRSL